MPKKLVLSALLVITSLSSIFSESVKPSQDIPGGLDSSKTPLFISLGFDDNKYADGVDWVVNELFAGRNNHAGSGNKATFDGTPMKCDFYVITNSDLPFPSADYPTANDFFNVEIPDSCPVSDSWARAYSAGFGINNHTYTHNYNLSDLNYDTQKSNMPSLLESIGHASRFLVNITGIPYSQIYGIRTPYLASSASSNDSYRATRDLGMLYDCTDDCGMQGNAQADWARPYFPGTMEDGWIWWAVKATPNLWQVPNAIYPLSADGTFSVKGFDSGTSNGWPSGISGSGFFNQMRYAIDYHYKRNRAPLDLGLHSDYYSQEADQTSGTAASKFSTPLSERRQALEMLLDYVESDLPGARVVTKVDIIRWMRNPVTLNDLSRNDELTYKTDNPSGKLGGATTTSEGSSTAEINGSTVNVTVNDKKDWTIDSYAGIKFDLINNLSGAHSINITYKSSVPLELRLNQSDLNGDDYQFGLATTDGSQRTVKITLNSDMFMQKRPISTEGDLDLSKVSSISLVATAFDTTMTGNFDASIEVYGAGQITSDVGISSITKNYVNNNIKINSLKRNQLQINTNVAGKYKIEIFSSKGQLVKSSTANLKVGQNYIAVNKLSSGCNIIRVSKGNSKATKKIIMK